MQFKEPARVGRGSETKDQHAKDVAELAQLLVKAAAKDSPLSHVGALALSALEEIPLRDVSGQWLKANLVIAAINMERSIEALGPALAEVEVETSPQLARSMQATENTWRKMENEFGLLTSVEVSAAVGSSSPNRSYASDQRAAGKLLAVKRPGGLKYPGFQIDSVEHTIRPVMQDLITVASAVGRSEAGLALWIVSPSGYLDGARPVDLLDDSETVVEAARQSFNVQW